MATLSQEEEALLETLGIDKETLHGALRVCLSSALFFKRDYTLTVPLQAGLDSNSIASGWLDGSEAVRANLTQ